MNKFDEITVSFDQESVDIGVITETWFKPGLLDYLNLSTMFQKTKYEILCLYPQYIASKFPKN